MPPLVITHFASVVIGFYVIRCKSVTVDNAFGVTLRAFNFFPMIFSAASNLVIAFFLAAIRADNHFPTSKSAALISRLKTVAFRGERWK